MKHEPRSGARTFVILPGGREVVASWRERWVDGGPGWSPELLTEWHLSLDGQPFALFDCKDDHPLPFLSINDGWKERGEVAPLRAVPAGPDRFRVRFDDYYSHHLGTVRSDIELVFDLAHMRIEYRATHDVDISQ